jgi:hypothetical protein
MLQQGHSSSRSPHGLTRFPSQQVPLAPSNATQQASCVHLRRIAICTGCRWVGTEVTSEGRRVRPVEGKGNKSRLADEDGRGYLTDDVCTEEASATTAPRMTWTYRLSYIELRRMRSSPDVARDVRCGCDPQLTCSKPIKSEWEGYER